MPMAAIVVWGAGGHAKVVAQSLRRSGRWQLEGFIDDVDASRRGEPFFGSQVLGGREALVSLAQRGVHDVVLAFGHNEMRLAIARELSAQGWEFPTIVDATALVADDAMLGEGCYVAAGAIVQPGTRIGAQAIVNTGVVVEHDNTIGEGVHLSPRACLAGHVSVGRCSWIGAGALLRDRVQVGEGVVIGMGAVVTRNVPAGVTMVGNPARLMSLK
jgi:UDP-N-acetylbacillosamine N-acetyltransferase